MKITTNAHISTCIIIGTIQTSKFQNRLLLYLVGDVGAFLFLTQF